eukprot:5831226-Amphidinium_carterae.1
MATSNAALPTPFAEPMQMVTCEGEPHLKRPRMDEGPHSAALASGSNNVPGKPASSHVQLRHAAQRRWIFQQRGQRCPDNWPFAGHTFLEGQDYSRVRDGQPIPYDE